MLYSEKQASVGDTYGYKNQGFQVCICLHTLMCVCFHLLYNFWELKAVVLTVLRRGFKNIRGGKKPESRGSEMAFACPD